MKAKKISKPTKPLLDDSYLDPANHKVRITMWVDGDTVQRLKTLAAKERTKYQTLANKILGDTSEFMMNSLSKKKQA